MNTIVIPGAAEPTLHLCYRSTNKSTTTTTTNSISRISLTSQLTKSRISTTNPSGRGRTRSIPRIQAVYAPAVETTESLYEVLGIAESCSSLSDIKKAYKTLARKYHPDVSSPDRVDEHTQRFIMVREAYETLSDSKSRALYDRNLSTELGSAFSPRNYHQYNQRREETGEWESQLDGLKQRSMNGDSRQKMSWGAQLRNKKNSK